MEIRTFGKEIRRLRREAGLNLVDLAKAAEFTVTHVSDIERGIPRPPESSKIVAMLQRLGKPELTGELVTLAAQEKKAVQIKIKGSSALSDMLVNLARRVDSDGVDEETARKINEILEKRGQADR